MILEGTEYSPTYTNTTIGAVITNAKLTKEQANKLADIAHDGYAMAIRPVHTMADGDTVFGRITAVCMRRTKPTLIL